MMTLRAHALGMPRTTFRNASGLPDWNQVTTARDLAVLARHMISDFPGYYGYFSTPYFIYHGRTIYNHDRMLQSYPGADGLKTGYIDASRYNLITSATHGGVRLVGVVLGAGSNAERDIHMTALLDQGFDQSGIEPVYMARQAPSFPSLVAAAQAAPLALVPRPLVVQARPFHRAAEPSFRELAREARPSMLPHQRVAKVRAMVIETPHPPAIRAIEPASHPTLRAPPRLRDGVRGATRGTARPYS